MLASVLTDEGHEVVERQHRQPPRLDAVPDLDEDDGRGLALAGVARRLVDDDGEPLR
jgi:hypothetical protein